MILNLRVPRFHNPGTMGPPCSCISVHGRTDSACEVAFSVPENHRIPGQCNTGSPRESGLPVRKQVRIRLPAQSDRPEKRPRRAIWDAERLERWNPLNSRPIKGTEFAPHADCPWADGGWGDKTTLCATTMEVERRHRTMDTP